MVRFTFGFCCAIINLDHTYDNMKLLFKEEHGMGFLLILGVCLAFLTAIFTAGYNERPGLKKK